MEEADRACPLPQTLNQEALLHRIANRIRRSLELQEILTATVAEVRSFLGSDRVTIYRFHGDGSGVVIAESIRESRLPSLLGLNFPADDIPDRAREVFLKTRQCAIVDVASRQTGLSPLSGAEIGKVLNTEDIRYRPADPCHIEYLKAMKVKSSLVVPILSGDRLWGLLVSHHTESTSISGRSLQGVRLIADQVSIAIAQSTLLDRVREQAQQEATINRIASLLHASLTVNLQTALEETVDVFQGSGGRLYLCVENAQEFTQLYTCGEQPCWPEGEDLPIEDRAPWHTWLRAGFLPVPPVEDALDSSNNSPWIVADLYKEPLLKTISPAFRTTRIRGLLVLPLQYRRQLLGYLSIFRDEIETETLWAGQFDPDRRQILPRKSFATWKELKRGQCREWTRNEMVLACALAEHFAMAVNHHTLYQRVQSLNETLECQVRERTAALEQSLEAASVFQRVTDQIRSTLNLETTLQTIVSEVRALLDTDRVLIYQFKGDGPGKVTVEDVDKGWHSILGHEGADNWCFPQEYVHLYLAGRVGKINDVSAATLTGCHRDFLQRLQVQANLLVPIKIDERLWGLLVAHECRAPRTWQEAETTLLKQLADQAAIAIQQAELYEQSHQVAAAATEQAKQLERTLSELKHTQAQLIQTEKMSSLGQMVAGIAHEINNPVNFISGNLEHTHAYAQDLLDILSLYQKHYPTPHAEIRQTIRTIDLEFLTEDLPRTLASMKVGANRIRQIVLSLRNFSRFDQSEMKPVDIHEGIDSTLMILQHRLKVKGSYVGVEAIKHYGELPAVECYAGQLNQVFMNILSNAIDALEEAREGQAKAEGRGQRAEGKEQEGEGAERNTSQAFHPQITICTEATARNTAVIRILNNGPCMPESVRSRIFDPFFTTKPVGKGTGLGLAISYQIVVDRHGGILRCTSTPEIGTEFWIEIPLSPGIAINK